MRMKNKYGWISIDQLNGEHFQKFIHPDSLDTINSAVITDSVFKCTNELSNNFVELQSSEVTLKLNRKVFRVMPKQPDFPPKSEVSYISSKGKMEFGIVVKIDWHNNKEELFYTLEVKGKMKSKRYFENELSHVSTSP